MFQVKVPSWGSKSTATSFEVVSAPNAADSKASKKRQEPTSHKNDSLSSSAPAAKRAKQKESSAVETHQTHKVSSSVEGPMTSKPSKPQNKKDFKKSSSTPNKSHPEPSSSATKQKAILHASSSSSPSAKTSSKPAKQSKPNNKPASSSATSKTSKSKSKGQKSASKKQGRKNDDSDVDSIDELFGSYGASDSDMSYTSDELEEAGIVIHSPKKHGAQSESERSDSNSDSDSDVQISKKAEYSSDGFSSEDEEEGAPKQSKLSATPTSKAAAKLSAKQEALRAKLEGGHFRFINEQLYTTTGKEAFKLFQAEPVMFDVYHQGYRNQVEKWPENPLDLMIKYLKKQPVSHVVADFGCGEARLAQSVPQKKVHSFDLVARNKFITACDIAHVPLKDSSVDVAVFCLSLMGTNVEDFLKEAFRVLKVGGTLKIAEVKSRFEKVATFTEQLEKLGFDIKTKDETNKMFILFSCTKSSRTPAKNTQVTLKPCIYKRR